jgi:hypothetical protein
MSAIKNQILQRINNFSSEQIKILIQDQGFEFKELVNASIHERKLLEIGANYFKSKIDQGKLSVSDFADLDDRYSSFKEENCLLLST